MGDRPYVAFSSDELSNKPEIGNTVLCPNCSESHTVKYGDEVLEDGTKIPSRMLAYVICNDNKKSYLVGINGKQI